MAEKNKKSKPKRPKQGLMERFSANIGKLFGEKVAQGSGIALGDKVGGNFGDFIKEGVANTEIAKTHDKETAIDAGHGAANLALVLWAKTFDNLGTIVDVAEKILFPIRIIPGIREILPGISNILHSMATDAKRIRSGEIKTEDISKNIDNIANSNTWSASISSSGSLVSQGSAWMTANLAKSVGQFFSASIDPGEQLEDSLYEGEGPRKKDKELEKEDLEDYYQGRKEREDSKRQSQDLASEQTIPYGAEVNDYYESLRNG